MQRLLEIKKCYPYLYNKDFPHFISFPRSGTHWVWYLLEQYFERPILPACFIHNNDNYLAIRTHDMELSLQPNNVLYLYRKNSAECVFSCMRFFSNRYPEMTNIRGKVLRNNVNSWTEQYVDQISKWLFNDTKKKTIITYEGLVKDMHKEISKAILHFTDVIDEKKLYKLKCTKEIIKKHRKGIIPEYKNSMKTIFVRNYSKQIRDKILKLNPKLEEYIL